MIFVCRGGSGYWLHAVVFITELAFKDEGVVDAAKVGIFLASSWPGFVRGLASFLAG